jgi:hypothetical protein
MSQIYSLFHTSALQLREWIFHFKSQPSSKIVACTGWNREQSEIMFHASLYSGVHHSIPSTGGDDTASSGSRLIYSFEGVFKRV